MLLWSIKILLLIFLWPVCFDKESEWESNCWGFATIIGEIKVV